MKGFVYAKNRVCPECGGGLGFGHHVHDKGYFCSTVGCRYSVGSNSGYCFCYVPEDDGRFIDGDMMVRMLRYSESSKRKENRKKEKIDLKKSKKNVENTARLLEDIY